MYNQIKTLKDEKVQKLFSDLGVFTPEEMDARHEIELENYVMKIQIEARVLGDMLRNHVIPSAIKYQNELIDNVEGLKSVLGAAEGKKAAETQLDFIKRISNHINEMNSLIKKMIDERRKANKIEDAEKKAEAYCDKVKVYFDEIRYHSDKLEITIDDQMLPFPKLRELLFTR